MEDLIKQLMSQMNKRFDKLEQETGQMNKRFDKLEQETGQMNKRFDKLEQETSQMNNRFDKLDQNLEAVKQEIINNQTENRSYFKHIETKLEQQQRTFELVSDELRGIKIDIEYLSEKTGKHDKQINNLSKRIEV